MMTKQATTAALLWTATLGASAIFGSYFFACVFPFVALATIAALTLDTRRAAILVGAVWLANQAVGFGFRDYPQTLDTIGWGIAIGIAAFAGLAAARVVLGKSPALLSPRSLLALGAAFVAYEGVLFAWALVAGGLETFSPRIVATIALNDAVWFAGLVALRLVLTRTAPALFGAKANALPA